MPIDAQVARARPRRGRRARPADRRPRARRGRVTRRASRTRSSGSCRYGQPGYVPRHGPRRRSRRSARSAPRAASPRSRTSAQAPDRISLLRDLIGEGLDGLESHHRSFDAGDARAGGRDRAGARPGRDRRHRLPRRHWARTREAHAGLVMPDALVAGLRARARASERADRRTDRRGMTITRPHDHPQPARPRHRAAGHRPRRPARPVRARATSAWTSSGPRRARCRRSSSGRSAAR